jgi:dTMP kinase
MFGLAGCLTQGGGYNRRLKRGLFITFEGIDGSGKTTQLRRLESFLAAKGFAVTVAQEPGGTRVGHEIRRLLLDVANEDLQPVPELLLYFASRAQNIEEVIEPALREGRIVVADRFTDATVAYQGFGRELGIEVVRKIESVACQGMEPDLTLLLDIDIETGVGRALDRNADQTDDESRMEQESRVFYERVAEGYAALQAAARRMVPHEVRGLHRQRRDRRGVTPHGHTGPTAADAAICRARRRRQGHAGTVAGGGDEL